MSAISLAVHLRANVIMFLKYLFYYLSYTNYHTDLKITCSKTSVAFEPNSHTDYGRKVYEPKAKAGSDTDGKNKC